ncbi:AMP-binding protein [Catenovulum sp. SX2]|uniref:AMP-binding protein n=1 Tax=Catenovulum sp. SX2 TaxID=3398614 RepID=UPI003F8680A7
MSLHNNEQASLLSSLERFGEQPSLIHKGRTYSYTELQQQVDKVAQTLEFSLTKRKLVFIEVANNPMSVIVYLACVQYKQAVLLLSEQKTTLNQQLLERYQPNLYINTASNSLDITTRCDYQHQLHPDLCLLLSTSGSTGSPKLVKLSNTNVRANTQSIIEYLNIQSKQIAISSLKISYSYGLSVLNTHLHCGATIVLTDASALSDEFWSLIAQYQVTNFAGVPYHYQVLQQRGFNFKNYPSLKLLTQAGGKLEASLVEHYVKLAQLNQCQFVVMYGQTEASPRMAYLAMDIAVKYPQAIGRAIPGGELYLVDDAGCRIQDMGQEGELIYQGPNVMLGYAADKQSLLTDDELECLHTGDLAVQVESGVFQIVGRRSRFIKPMSIRVNLDEIKSWLVTQQINCEVTSNQNEQVLIGYTSKTNAKVLTQMVAQHLNLPEQYILVKQLKTIPPFESGKVDFKTLAMLVQMWSKWQITKAFASNWQKACSQVLGLASNTSESVIAVFQANFEQVVTKQESFQSLGGDSFSYVQIETELTQMIQGKLPENWFELSIGDLEEMSREAVF